MNNDILLSYLAGFFDGEGCVYILKNSKRITYSLEISFTNSAIEPLELAKSIFNGQISVSFDKRKNKKITNRLRIRGNEAKAALELLLPFLIVKKERAELAIDFQTKMKGIKARTRNISIEDCEAYKIKITKLNDKVWNSRKAA